MSIIYLLVAFGIGTLAVAIWVLFWAVDSGQFDDLESQGKTIFDEDRKP